MHLFNRETEKTMTKTRDEKSGGNVWEKVCSHIDFNPSTKKDAKTVIPPAGSLANKSEKKEEVTVKKDVSRMKAILLQLKNDPKAPGNKVVV